MILVVVSVDRKSENTKKVRVGNLFYGIGGTSWWLRGRRDVDLKGRKLKYVILVRN